MARRLSSTLTAGVIAASAVAGGVLAPPAHATECAEVTAGISIVACFGIAPLNEPIHSLFLPFCPPMDQISEAVLPVFDQVRQIPRFDSTKIKPPVCNAIGEHRPK